jgi:hypothetical protein
MKLKTIVLKKIETNSYKCLCGDICIGTLKYVKSTELNFKNRGVWHVKYNLPNMKSEQYFYFDVAKRGILLSMKSFILNFITI